MTYFRILALLALFVMAVGLTQTAHAQLDPCDPNQPQSALTLCNAERLDAWDGLLNEVYQRVIGTLDEAQEENLRQAQRAWITYRDLTCGMERARYEGGSIAPMIELTCLTRLTERRTRDLEEYMRP
ncbi:lysozyme inhibitor LprI family protein [Gymnodinialimonas hymeniacidonis]|uniref:lysozyme inhibitor LprI family protein n=1 Tax=Gymnodinialimonas hymeniacidonis TaxID=3126508 RepID=UPI0034C5CE5F